MPDHSPKKVGESTPWYRLRSSLRSSSSHGSSHAPLFVWFYNVTLSSVLLVATFHASFDGAINQLSYDVVPASNTARFLIFSAVIVLLAIAVIIATKGQLGRAKEAVDIAGHCL